MKKKYIVIISITFLLLFLILYGFISVSSIQESKTRDSFRRSTIESLKSDVEMFYQDNSKYPTKDELIDYKSGYYPKDSLEGETINGCTFGYDYEVFDGLNYDGVEAENQSYIISICLENENSITLRDGGNDDNKYEVSNLFRYQY